MDTRFSDMKIGIALSGGGAPGVAHIGILKALRENGIEPEVTAGTSSGAIVGPLYAFGAATDDLEAFARVGIGIKLLRFGNPLRGLIKLTLLREKLEAVLPVDDFECLQRPLYVTASDLQKGELKIFSEGPLIAAVQASCAVPLLFHPVVIDGRQYIDGGLYLNLPSQTIRDKCDFLIGSNVMPLVSAEVGPINSLWGISNRVFDLSVHHNASPSRELCDFLIEPEDLMNYHVYNFARSDKLVEVGYRAAMDVMPTLLRELEKYRVGNPAGSMSF